MDSFHAFLWRKNPYFSVYWAWWDSTLVWLSFHCANHSSLMSTAIYLLCSNVVHPPPRTAVCKRAGQAWVVLFPIAAHFPSGPEHSGRLKRTAEGAAKFLCSCAGRVGGETLLLSLFCPLFCPLGSVWVGDPPVPGLLYDFPPGDSEFHWKMWNYFGLFVLLAFISAVEVDK